MTKLVPKKTNEVETSRILGDTLKSLTEGFTGIASSDRKDLILSVGHIFQRLRSGVFLQTLKLEWDAYKKKGRIKDDYEQTEQHKVCLQEILDFLDKDSPDEIRFSFLKKILFTASTETVSDRDSVLPQQYMRLCRLLTSGEILVLAAGHNIMKDIGVDKEDSQAINWLIKVAKNSGLKHPELVELYEPNLIEKQLITPRTYGDKSGVRLGKNFRFTDLAGGIWKFIEAYDDAAEVPKEKQK